MPDVNPIAIQVAFGFICVLTGIVGTFLQVAGALYAQRGGPREQPVVARLSIETDQLIFIYDRAAVAGFGVTLSNAGAAVLFASVIAGLTINFPKLWPIGTCLFILTITFGAGRILLIEMHDLWQTRLIQEDLYALLPPDGTILEKSLGRPDVISTYKQRVLTRKPDIATSIFIFRRYRRPFLLYSFVRNALRRESNERKLLFETAMHRINAKTS